MDTNHSERRDLINPSFDCGCSSTGAFEGCFHPGEEARGHVGFLDIVVGPVIDQPGFGPTVLGACKNDHWNSYASTARHD
jgi:hypothetical protein